MAITVTGNLRSPLDLPLEGVEVRLTSELSFGDTVQTAIATYTTGALGAYNFTMVNGRHTIEAKVEDTFELIGDCIVDDSTPTPINLADLIKYTTPIVPPVIIPTDPVWQTLFEDLRSDVDTVNQEDRDQMVDGSTSEIEVSDIYTNTRLDSGMSEETEQAASGTSSSVRESLAYSDGNLQEAAITANSTNVRTNTIKESDEIYRSSGGKITIESGKDANTSNTNTRDHTTVVDETTDISMVQTKELSTGTRLVNFIKSVFISPTETESSNVSTTATDLGADNASTSRTDSSEVGYRDSGGAFVSDPRVTIVDAIEANGDSTTRSHNITVDGSGTSNIIDESIVGSKTATETLTNDGARSVKNIAVDEFSVGTAIRVDTVLNQVTIDGQLVIGNPDDFKGDRGDTVIEVYMYSPTNTLDPTDGSWHSDFVTGDLYRISNTSTNGVIDPLVWSTPAKLAAEDGLDGDTEYWEYNYSIDGTTAWHATLVDGDFWRRERLVVNSVEGAWSTPARIAGADGDDGQIVIEEYEYSIDGLTIWHTNFSTGDHFRRTRLLKYEGGTPIPIPVGAVPIETTPWTVAAKLVPQKGIDYIDGTVGNHGSGSWILEVATAGDIPTNDEDIDALLAVVASRPAQQGDIVTFQGPPTLPPDDRFAVSYLRNDQVADASALVAWEDFSLVINGNAIVNGTLAAEALIAESITGDQISASATIIAGSGGLMQSLLTVGDNLGIQWGYDLGSGVGSMTNPNWQSSVIQSIVSDNIQTDLRVSPNLGAPNTTGVTVTIDGTDYFFGYISANWYRHTAPIWTAANIGTAYTVTISSRFNSSNVAGLNGDDTNPDYSGWRMWAGNETPTTAPYRVSSGGQVTMSNCAITGGTLSIGSRFSITNTGVITINSSGDVTSDRLVISGDRLEVFEGTTLRVRIGRL